MIFRENLISVDILSTSAGGWYEKSKMMKLWMI